MTDETDEITEEEEAAFLKKYEWVLDERFACPKCGRTLEVGDPACICGWKRGW